VAYLKARAGEEPSASLRAFVEAENASQNERFGNFKTEATGRTDELFQLDQKMNKRVGQIRSDLSKFQTYCGDFSKAQVAELLSLENPDELKNDNEGQGEECEADILRLEPGEAGALAAEQQTESQPAEVSRDQAATAGTQENELTKARLVSFKQLYDFNNLCLNRSFLRKRTSKSELNIEILQAQVKALQKWRVDIEARMKQQFIEVDEHFKADDSEFEEYKKRVSRLFDEKQNHLVQHDAEVKLINNTLQTNKEDREELHR